MRVAPQGGIIAHLPVLFQGAWLGTTQERWSVVGGDRDIAVRAAGINLELPGRDGFCRVV